MHREQISVYPVQRRVIFLAFFIITSFLAAQQNKVRLNSMEKVKERFWYQYLDRESPDFQVPEIISEVYESGATLHRLKKGQVPQTRVTLLFSGGEMEENEMNSGLTSLWSELLVFSGSKNTPRDKLSSSLEQRASSLSASSDLRQAVMSLGSLSVYFLEDFRLLEEILLDPNFAEEDLAILKSQVLQGIARRAESPARALSLSAKKVLFPKGPRGLVSTNASIDSIGVDQIKAWHEKMVCSKRLNILLTGFYDESTLAAIEQLTTKIQQSCDLPDADLLKVSLSRPNSSVYHLPMDIPQSTLIFYGEGVPHNSPDYYTWRLFDYILGGSSFNSVMTRKIRTEMGFAYSAYSSLSSDAVFGRSILFTQTANETLQPVENIISDLLDNPEKYVTDDSIELAKTSLTNKLVFLYETPSQYLKLWYDLKLDGLDQKYLETFPQNLNSVTREQILRYAKKYYNKQNFYKFVAAPATLVKEENKAIISLP